MKLVKEIVEKIKNLWNIYGGVAISTLIAWLTNWSKIEMDRWSSYLLLTITCISLLTFFKVILAKKKTKSIPDALAMQQKSVKTINAALNPEQVGQEIGTAILFTIHGGVKVKEKIVKFFKVIWGNKFTALSLLLNLIYTGFSQYLLYSDELKHIQFFEQNKLLCIIVATAVSVIWLIIELVKDIKNLGFESLTTLNKKWAERKAEKEARLSKEQREVVKSTIGSITDNIKIICDTLKTKEELLKPLLENINSYNTLKQIGIPVSTEQEQEYAKSVNEVSKLNAEKTMLETKKKQLEYEVGVLKAKL